MTSKSIPFTKKSPVAVITAALLAKPEPRIPSFDTLPDSAFIREFQLVQSPKTTTPAPLPFYAPTLWRKVTNGTFPRPHKLSERVTAWNVGAVRAWMAAQKAQVYDTSAVTAKLSKRTALVKS